MAFRRVLARTGAVQIEGTRVQKACGPEPLSAIAGGDMRIPNRGDV